MAERNEKDQFWDDLAPIIDGDEATLARHADRLADDDAARDARYEAARVAEDIALAGVDFVPNPALEARVLSAIDQRAGQGPQPAPSLPKALAAPAPVTRNDPPQAKAAAPRSRAIYLWLAVPVAVAAAVVGAMYLPSSGSSTGPVAGLTGAFAPGSALSARVTRLARAADDHETGLTIRLPEATDFVAAAVGAQLTPGTTLRTDERTRIELALSDGSTVTLNQATEVTLDGSSPRHMRLAHGELVADIAHFETGPHAFFDMPTGVVEVLGTKFILTATDDMSSVRVTRGTVRMSANGHQSEVKAGHEGLMPRQGPATVTPAAELAQALAWSELDLVPGDDEPIRGLGELRARRPGEQSDRERPLTLAEHKVSVRIVDGIARTEIEESFQNDSNDTLEGIYRFPLPPNARIASLSLEVDGRWEQGAFVERNRAQKIWRGVIRNATPTAQRAQNEEFIWVPGPWRDPALLEWQRGGRFELRIFPIAAHGARRIRLAYTQSIAATGKERTYVYPLPFSSDASTRVGHFEADVRIAGQRTRVNPVGYAMTSAAEGNGTRLSMSADSFLPSGDLRVDYELERGDAELQSWTFSGAATVAPPENSREGNPEVDAAQRAYHADSRGYVAFALRPQLPAWTESRARDYVLVVDSSQSMVGERYERATNLAVQLVSEMDRRDRIVVLACDTACQGLEEGPLTPSAETAQRVRAFFASVTPAGASDIASAMRHAAGALADKDDPSREIRVLYMGDGVASAGHRRAATLSAEIHSMATDRVSFTTVGIGADSDDAALTAIARAGGGQYIPYIPGQRTTTAAVAVLETTYGASLRDARVEVPAGIVDVYPSTLPTIRAGEEVIVVGRLASGAVTGEVRISGKVAGRDYEQRYPVTLAASTNAGNAFVPQLWAQKTIEQLELDGRGENEARVIALSKGFGVLSRSTSLLVLESEAMFRAFGVDRAQPTVQWTGEDDVESAESEGLLDHADETGASLGMIGTGDGVGRASASARGAGSGGGFAAGALANAAPAAEMATRARSASDVSADSLDREEERRVRPTATVPARPQPAEPATVTAASQAPPPPMDPRGGRWMRRIYTRVGSIETSSAVSSNERRAVEQAETALRMSPDSRDRHRDLVRALGRAGELVRAKEVVGQWLTRNPLDSEALIHLADLTAREGKRDEALRILSGIVDLAPTDVVLQERMAKAFERFADLERSCAHRIAVAELDASNVNANAAALRCERSLGRTASSRALLDGVTDAATRGRVESVAATAPANEQARGEIRVDATWSGHTDLDVALVTPQGARLSFMGGRTTVSAQDATAIGRESLALRRATVGNYVIEVTRTKTGDTTPASGRVTVEVLGTRRTLDFTMSGDRTTVGRVAVRREAQMVGW